MVTKSRLTLVGAPTVKGAFTSAHLHFRSNFPFEKGTRLRLRNLKLRVRSKRRFISFGGMEFLQEASPLQVSPKRLLEGPAETAQREKRPKKGFQTRCNPRLNYKIITNLKVKEKFRTVLSDLGLDCLLDLRLTRLQRDLCADLARRVDVPNSSLTVHGKYIPLTYASVTKIMGLQCSGVYKQFIVELNKEQQLAICSKYNLDASARISQNSLLSYLEDAHAFDEEFKAKFLLFMIATMLRPTTNVHIHFREHMPMLSNLDILGEMNWAKFVLDGLLQAVTTFQKRGARSLGGCLLYLQLLYLESISPVPWTHYDDCLLQTPCLQNWSDDRVSVVAKLMREQGGIQSSKVTVRTLSIQSSGGSAYDFDSPQLLTLEVLMARLRRRFHDQAADVKEMIREFGHVIGRLCRRVEQLEGRKESEV